MADTPRFLSLSALSRMPPPVWLIRDLLEVGGISMIAGPPGSMKSFLALDFMLCLALGIPWNGKQVLKQRVLYILGEGKAGLLRRVAAWSLYHKLTPAQEAELDKNFLVTFDVPQMAQKPSVDNLLAGLASLQFDPGFVVIDTFARSIVGLDENSQQDMGLWVDSADRLRQKGASILAVHHTAKNTEFGVKYRGASAIMGAMDTAFTLVAPGKGKRAVLSMVKQKDHDEIDDIHFNRLIVQPDPRREGSIVLVPTPDTDERFTEQGDIIEANIEELINTVFDSDRARARVLAKAQGLSESAAQSRIARFRTEHRSPMIETRITSGDPRLLPGGVDFNPRVASDSRVVSDRNGTVDTLTGEVLGDSLTPGSKNELTISGSREKIQTLPELQRSLILT